MNYFDESKLNDLDDESREAAIAFKERLDVAKSLAFWLAPNPSADTILAVYDRLQSSLAMELATEPAPAERRGEAEDDFVDDFSDER